MSIPRPEHPNPQWERKNWINLNGEWEFEFDFSSSALERKVYEQSSLKDKITVPFCPESELSGIGFKDFIPAACYKRELIISADDLKNKVLLHFGAVDYKAILYINQKEVGTHIGGYTSFSFDISDYLTVGENSIFLYVEDDVRSGVQSAGKQSPAHFSKGCYYTRTTGIWQTVWLEFVPQDYILNARFLSDINKPSVTVTGLTSTPGSIEIDVFLNGKSVGNGKVISNNNFYVEIPLSEKCLWEVGKGGLYDVTLKFKEDTVKSYFGLRSIRLDGYKFLINEKSVFQRLVLDQGFYPDGIYTAPSDDALLKDIEISLAAGFNGARLHEKIFEARFLYHADRLGYIVWGEYPNWGIKDYKNYHALADYITCWSEAVKRDINHPSVIGWCPLNETWGYGDIMNGGRTIDTIYRLTKALDDTRPCIDTSGNNHSVTDIFDLHDYDQNPESFKKRYETFSLSGDFDYSEIPDRGAPFFLEYQKYTKGQPMFISEYGGIKWDTEDVSGEDCQKSWGYGNAPKTEDEFLQRYKALTDILLDNKYMFGFCYTQLYDIEQEKNGIYTYGRKEKFDITLIKAITSRKAAIEQ